MSEFLKILAVQARAASPLGERDKRSDEEILAGFVKAPKSGISFGGSCAAPSKESVARLEAFYASVAQAVEAKTGKMAAPLVKVSGEGYGRAVIIVGKLAAASKSLRDVGGFGFSSLDKLTAEASKMVDQAAATIAQFPEAASA